MWHYAIATTAEEHPLIGRGAGKPIATGLGLTALVDNKSGVHNSFIGYAFYSGFPSALLVAWAFVLALAGSWRHRARPGIAPLFGATVAVAATCMTNVALETPYIAGPAWAVMGATVGAVAATRTPPTGGDEPALSLAR
jgi:O-antigen ligase